MASACRRSVRSAGDRPNVGLRARTCERRPTKLTRDPPTRSSRRRQKFAPIWLRRRASEPRLSSGGDASDCVRFHCHRAALLAGHTVEANPNRLQFSQAADPLLTLANKRPQTSGRRELNQVVSVNLAKRDSSAVGATKSRNSRASFDAQASSEPSISASVSVWLRSASQPKKLSRSLSLSLSFATPTTSERATTTTANKLADLCLGLRFDVAAQITSRK